MVAAAVATAVRSCIQAKQKQTTDNDNNNNTRTILFLIVMYAADITRSARRSSLRRGDVAIALNFIIMFNTRKYFIIYTFKRWLNSKYNVILCRMRVARVRAPNNSKRDWRSGRQQAHWNQTQKRHPTDPVASAFVYLLPAIWHAFKAFDSVVVNVCWLLLPPHIDVWCLPFGFSAKRSRWSTFSWVSLSLSSYISRHRWDWA